MKLLVRFAVSMQCVHLDKGVKMDVDSLHLSSDTCASHLFRSLKITMSGIWEESVNSCGPEREPWMPRGKGQKIL